MIDDELHIICLYPKAHGYIDDAERIIKQSLIIQQTLVINAEQDDFYHLLTAIYSISLNEAKQRSTICGVGTITAYIVQDPTPRYKKVWRDATGYIACSEKISDIKDTIRATIGNNFLVHSSINQQEAYRDIFLFTNKTYSDMAHDIAHNAVTSPQHITYKKPLFTTQQQLYRHLNATLSYVIMRDDYVSGDVDILTSNPVHHIATMLDAEHIIHRLYGFKNSQVKPLDFLHPYQYLLCPKWCFDVLDSKEFCEKNNYYRPTLEHRFFLLLYHIVIEKPDIDAKYLPILQRYITELGFDVLASLDLHSKEHLYQILIRFMRQKNYSAPNNAHKRLYTDQHYIQRMRQQLHLDVIEQTLTPTTPNHQVHHATPANYSTIRSNNAINSLNLKDIAHQTLQQIDNAQHHHHGYNFHSKTISFLPVPYMTSIAIPCTLDINQQPQHCIVKILYTPYKIIYDSLQHSLHTLQHVEDGYILKPRKVAYHNPFIIILYDKCEGRNLLQYLQQPNPDAAPVIIKELHNITTWLRDNAINHHDLYWGNIMLHNNALIIIDSKHASHNTASRDNRGNLNKPTSDDDGFMLNLMAEGINNRLSSTYNKASFSNHFMRLGVQQKLHHYTHNLMKPMAKSALFSGIIKHQLSDIQGLLLHKLQGHHHDTIITPNNYNEYEHFYFIKLSKHYQEIEHIRQESFLTL